ncbi:molybdenum cofactor guanylyltransferase MobA [Methylomonas sp. MgM2]
MSRQNKVSGVVLAGGLGRRMGRQDKGLTPFHGRPLICFALAAMAPLVDELFISANRNQESYRQFGYRVIKDRNSKFDGPLAGILAAMQAAANPTLLISPCDSPMIQSEDLQQLLDAMTADVEIAVASDGKRLHPVFAALNTGLQADLCRYLDGGERKLQTWFGRHKLAEVDFCDRPEIFLNINTPEQLRALSKSKPI